MRSYSAQSGGRLQPGNKAGPCFGSALRISAFLSNSVVISFYSTLPLRRRGTQRYAESTLVTRGEETLALTRL